MLTVLAVTLSFLPLLLYWWKKLAPDRLYLVISLFWTLNGILYAPEIFHWNWYYRVSDQITLYYNLIDAPFIFTLFYFAFRKKFFLYLIAAFILFEAAMIAWKGFNFDSNTIIIGTGSFISLALNIWGISRYFLSMQHTDTENVLVYVFAGFIFYYGLFTVVYYYNYLRASGPEMPYVIFINYIAICLATALISYGFWKYAYTNYSEERY